MVKRQYKLYEGWVASGVVGERMKYKGKSKVETWLARFKVLLLHRRGDLKSAACHTLPDHAGEF